MTRARWIWFAAIYLALLAASSASRWWRTDRSLEDLESAHIVSESRQQPIDIAYRQWRPDKADLETIILIHGSPGSSRHFRGLGPRLGLQFDVVAPDLPGFGQSTRSVDDYSIRAHANDVIDLVDHLGIGDFHVVGFSLGGGVALHLVEQLGARVTSLTLLSSIGVQELELLGEYHINHALHGLQLGALWLVHRAVPHFGLLDGFPLDLPFARNFFDTDQRPLRNIIATLDQPTLILHGHEDILVPAAAAHEHHRLIAQSQLRIFAGNHFLVFRQPDVVAAPIVEFIGGISTAPTRTSASRERLAQSQQARSTWPTLSGLALLIALVLLALATLVSEDLTCIAAGLLVAQGRLSFIPAMAACAIGIILGDYLLYAIGRLCRPWLGLAPFRWFIDEDEIERSSTWFERRGGLVVLISRFLPGTRIPTYVAAGVLRTPVLKFGMFLIFPVLLWTPLLVGSAMMIGETAFASFDSFRTWALPTFAGLLVTMWVLLATLKMATSTRSRRRFVGSWVRTTQWEYWPRWIVYPPVVVYCSWLALRFRSPTLFTLTNPGLPAGGGLVGESKSEILELFDQRWVARFRRLPIAQAADERTRTVIEFMHELDLDFPIVLKPEVGHRGDGVVIAFSEAEIQAFCSKVSADALAQEYVGGPELGLFYLRRPGAPNGRLFSITDKQRPTVVGDGSSSLERLILGSDRGAAKADQYLAENRRQLDRVPADGEMVVLLDVGSHSRGTIFLDGSHYASPALLNACDELARSCPGFYFGRFDIRGPSIDAIRSGQFKMVELNGVGSEATHIYDPDVSVWEAYRVLFEQWRLAFEIADVNRRRSDLRPATVREVIAMLIEHRKHAVSTESVR